MSYQPNSLRIAIVYLQMMKLSFFLFLAPVYFWMLQAPEHLWTNFCPSASFGCAIAPYGLPWYAFYFLITRFGYLFMGLSLWSIDTLITFKFGIKRYTLLFSLSSFLFFVLNPIDLLALWFASLSRYHPLTSFLALITKLPWPAPAYVWMYLWNVSFNHGNLFGYPLLSLWRYILLGLWIIRPLLLWIGDWLTRNDIAWKIPRALVYLRYGD